MGSTNTVPMIAPDGTVGDVPQDQVPNAVKAGGSIGVDLIAPDGSHGVVPMDKVHDAIRAGARFATATPGADMLTQPNGQHPTLPGNPSGTNVAGGLVKAGDTTRNVAVGAGKNFVRTQ